jgi:hypothetical protein
LIMFLYNGIKILTICFQNGMNILNFDSQNGMES